jgi:hypothetical protein
MAAESSRESGRDQMDAVIDDLIRDIFNEPGPSAESTARDMATTAALFEQVLGPGRVRSRGGALEKMLMAEAFAAELADALAPALAERLAPRLMKALEQLMAEGGPAAKKPASSGRPGGQGRKPEAR